MVSDPNAVSHSLPSSPKTLPIAARSEPSATEAAFLASIEDQVESAKRVQTAGIEADLRVTLDTTIRRLEQVVDLLRDSYSHAAELEVQLALTRSNLKVVLANNEMLEAALERDTADRHVGWRRSVPPDLGVGDDNIIPSTPSPLSSSVNASPTRVDPPPPSSASSSTEQLSDSAIASRFFKFRFARPAGSQRRHFTSPSMPSLSSSATFSAFGEGSKSHISSLKSEIDSLTKECSTLRLEKERAEKAKEECMSEKHALQDEMEVLSQALFEEANKLVSTERRKHANQLAELRTEKRALKHAIILVESENQRIKQQTLSEVSFEESIPEPYTDDTDSLPRLPLLIPLPFSPQIPTLVLNDILIEDDDFIEEEESIPTARPPPSPDWRQSRAFGRMETLHITGAEVLKLLEMQTQDGGEGEQGS